MRVARMIAGLMACLVVTLMAAEVGAKEGRKYGVWKGRRALGFAIPSGGGALVGAKFLIQDSSALSVDFGYKITIPDKGDNTGGFTIVPAYIHYLFSGRMCPFIKGAMNITKQEGVKFGDALSLGLGAFFGTEYFFTKQLSVAGELGIAINFKNDFNDITSQTGTGNLFLHFYF